MSDLGSPEGLAAHLASELGMRTDVDNGVVYVGLGLADELLFVELIKDGIGVFYSISHASWHPGVEGENVVPSRVTWVADTTEDLLVEILRAYIVRIRAFEDGLRGLLEAGDGC